MGEQRRNVLARAAETWGQYLESDVEIVINADFQALGGSNQGAVLAFAGPTLFFSDFTNRPLPEVYYAIALANSLAGSDLIPGTADLSVGVNESIDSNPNVLGGTGFYYGFDNNAGNQVDLLVTLLHEIGHGLGFLSSVNEANGTFPLDGLPDSFTLLMKDQETGKLWGDMTDNERRISAINDPDLVFTGASTEQASRRLLKPIPTGGMRLNINSPASLAGNYAGEAPNFGFGIPPWGLSGLLVLVDDGSGTTSDGCEEPFVNADEINGRIAVIDRGSCLFIEKVNHAQNAGAIAVVVVNNDGDELAGVDYSITIPSIFVGQTTGDLIKAALSDVQVTFLNQNELFGTRNNLLRLYAPNPTEPGSSISHWSPDAFPDLLMEPSIPDSVRPDLDLTLTALRDIGWKVSNIPFPHLSFEIWATENIPGSDNAVNEDPDNDGYVNLMEYAFGTNPEDPTSTPKPTTFTSSGNSDNLFSLEYERSPDPADIRFSLYKTDDLRLPFNEAINGVEYRRFDQTVGSDNQKTIELQIESTAEKQFF